VFPAPSVRPQSDGGPGRGDLFFKRCGVVCHVAFNDVNATSVLSSGVGTGTPEAARRLWYYASLSLSHFICFYLDDRKEKRDGNDNKIVNDGRDMSLFIGVWGRGDGAAFKLFSAESRLVSTCMHRTYLGLFVFVFYFIRSLMTQQIKVELVYLEDKLLKFCQIVTIASIVTQRRTKDVWWLRRKPTK